MKTFFKNILHEHIFFLIFYLKPIATSHKHSSAHSCFIPSFTYVYGWLLLCIGNIVFYSFPECILFLYSLDPRSPGVCILLLVPLSKSGSPRRTRRHFVPLFAKRAVSWNGETGRFPNEKSQSEISRRDPRGSPDLPRRGPSRLDADSCGSPVERRRRRWRRREEGRSG